MLNDYWKSFLRDVLWGTIKRAILYSLLLALVFVLLAAVAIATGIPQHHSGTRKALEGFMLFFVYGLGGATCGFLLGITTLRNQLERIVDAVYSTIRGMISTVLTKAGAGAQLIPTDQLRHFLESDARAWLGNFSRNFGAAKKIFSWLMTKPVERVRTAVLSDLLPAIKERNISASAVEEFVRHRVTTIVRIPVEAKLRALRVVAWAIGVSALVLPLLILRIG